MPFVFFGSSDFAKIVLEKLLWTQMRPILIITNPPKPKGRKQILSPSPVHLLAQDDNIPVLTPERLDDPKFIAEFKNVKPEFAILTAYGKIIPPELLIIPPKGFINLHPSLLPKWRGATPIQSAILNGDEETGVSLFLMDEELDHGPIIQNAEYRIQNARITYSELSKELALLGAELIIKTIPQFLEGKISPVPQNHSLATYCQKILPEDEKIHWDKTNIEIDRKVRALNPQPGVFTKAVTGRGDEIILKIIKGYPEEDFFEGLPGKVFSYQDKMAVKCGKGFYAIEEIKPASKRVMASEDFLRGNKWILNQILQ
ncbi:MAG: methionyl-tRNA formyltransferase [Candidatus Pacebacteria bacterium]|nr:methionyl-tRNA formyltransferase [Candidatus Paceibacterota bacterium]